MNTMYRLGRMNFPKTLVKDILLELNLYESKNEKYHGLENEDLRQFGIAAKILPTHRNTLEINALVAYNVNWHTDYESLTHILVLQSSGHSLGLNKYGDKKYYPLKTGDIIKFDVNVPHCLDCLNYRNPFIGLAYDTPYNCGRSLNKKTAVSFFKAFIHNIGYSR